MRVDIYYIINFHLKASAAAAAFFLQRKRPLQLMAVKIRRTAYGIRLWVFTLMSGGKNPTACKDERVLT